MTNRANIKKGEIRHGSQKSVFSNVLKPQIINYSYQAVCTAFVAASLFTDGEENRQYFFPKLSLCHRSPISTFIMVLSLFPD